MPVYLTADNIYVVAPLRSFHMHYTREFCYQQQIESVLSHVSLTPAQKNDTRPFTSQRTLSHSLKDTTNTKVTC